MWSRIVVLSCALLGFGCATPVPSNDPTEVAMRQVRIDLYVTSWCPYCQRARAWLDAGGYTYQAHDVEIDTLAAQFHRMVNPSGGVPTFAIDGVIVLGFSPERVREALRGAAARRRSARRSNDGDSSGGGPAR